MIKVIDVPNPTGTVLGDLNHKLAQDLAAAVSRYFDLATIAEIDYPQRLGGALSQIVALLVMIERETPLPKGVLEAYVETIRREWSKP